MSKCEADSQVVLDNLTLIILYSILAYTTAKANALAVRVVVSNIYNLCDIL